MKMYLIISLISMLLLFGCTTPQQATPTPSQIATITPTSTVQTQTSATPIPTQVGECTKSDLKFENVKYAEKIAFGEKSDITADLVFVKGTCAGEPTSATISLNDGLRVLQKSELNVILASQKVTFNFVPAETRTYNLKLLISTLSESELEDNNVQPMSIVSEPFGFSDISGDSAFEINSYNMRAQAITITKPTAVKSIELYIKKGPTQQYENFDFFVEIRPDAGNKPSGAVELSYSNGLPAIPTEWQWVKFSSPSKTNLVPGVYWVTVRTSTQNPVVFLHYKAGAKLEKPQYIMKSESTIPLEFKWVQADEGVFNFRISNDAVEVVDQSNPDQVKPSASPLPFDPYSAV